MRTNIVIDDDLMGRAQALGGYKTKRETVEAALTLLVEIKDQSAIKELRGIGWGWDDEEDASDAGGGDAPDRDAA